KLVVFTEELLSRPGADFVAAIRKRDEQAADAFVGELAVGGLRAIGIVPRRPKPDHEKALALGPYVITPDDLVGRGGFFVSPEVLPEGAGCSALARRMAMTLAAGMRRIDANGGPRNLEGGLTLDVPPGTVLVPQDGPDFIVYHAYALETFGQSRGG